MANIKTASYTMEQLEKSSELLKSGMSLKDVAINSGIKYDTLKKALILHGFRQPSKKYNIADPLDNNSYFEKIDTHEKAYILGFVFADGYIENTGYQDSKKFGMALQSSDKYILDYIKGAIGSKNKVSKYKNSYKFTVSSNKLVNDLINYGVDYSKSLKDFNIPQIDNKFINSFILGYFDGDGCITKKSSKYFSVTMCCNSKIFLNDISNILNSNGIKNTVSTEFGKSRKRPIYILTINKHENRLKFMDFIYNGSSIYLIRKYKKFMEIPR